MKRKPGWGLIAIFLVVSGCSTTTGGMYVRKTDPITGRTENIVYTKYYAASTWILDGKLGMDIWIDHEKEVTPVLHALQQVTGTLGPSDLEATGLVTLYLVNLEQKSVSIENLTVTKTSRPTETTAPQSFELGARTVLSYVPGAFPIDNYGEEVPLNVRVRVDGKSHDLHLGVERLTEESKATYKRSVPWFQSPYFPFEPPLTKIYRSESK